MAVDEAAALLVRIEATQAKFEKQMAAIARSGAKSAGDVEKNFKRANDNIAKGSGGAANSMKAASQAAGQLSFQLNDIATSLAGGQSPFQVMMQQGSQVTQVFNDMKARGVAIGPALLGTFTSLLNPISLITSGLILAVGAAVQFFSESEEGAEDANKTIEKQADLIRKVADAYGDQLPAVRALADELARIAKEGDIAAATAIVIDRAYEALKNTVAGTSTEFAGMIQTLMNAGLPIEDVSELQRRFYALEEAIKNNQDATRELKDFNDALSNAYEQTAIPGLKTLIGLYAALTSQIRESARAADEARRQEAGQVRAMTRGGPARYPPSPLTALPTTVPVPEQRPLDDYFADVDQAAERAAQSAADKTKRAAEKAAEKLNDTIARQTAVAVDAAATLVGKSETANAAEINAFLKRGGVDLDAARTAWCAAFVNSALAQVGIKGTGSNVATSFATWGQAVGLADIQRGDILVQQRGRAPGQTGGHVGFATGAMRATAEGITEIQMISGNASNQVQEDWVAANDVIARRAADAFILPADALDHLKTQSQEAKTALTDVEKQALDMQQAIQGAIGGLIKDLIAGKDASESLGNALSKVADKMLDIALTNLFKGFGGATGAAGGLFGGMLIPGILHKGGVAGRDGYGHGRAVPAALFANANRYHNGGLVSGEVPAILKRGEIVLPAGSRRGGSETINVRLQDDSGRMASIADQRIQTASGAIVKVSVVESTRQVQRRFPGMMANAQTRSA